jgi:tetratricopeptide (TPR) repeat protein
MPTEDAMVANQGQGQQRRRARRTLLVVLGVLGVGGILLAVWHLRQRAPLAEQAYTALATALEQKGRAALAKQVREQCREADACTCAHQAGRLGLDADLHAETLALLVATAGRCGPGLRGMEAEALARARRHGEAEAMAAQVLEHRPNDPYAVYALAHAKYVQGDAEKTRELCQQAIAAGRGSPAHLLLGLVAFHQGDFHSANASFAKMVQADQNDVDALYNLALVAHRTNRFRDAREGYLRVLRLRPDHLDARFNVALLVNGIGATAEARHHLDKLREVAPAGDDRILKLERALDASEPRRPSAPPGTAPPADSGSARTPSPPSPERSASGVPTP